MSAGLLLRGLQTKAALQDQWKLGILRGERSWASGCVCFERHWNSALMLGKLVWVAGVEKRIKSSIAGTSVFTLLGRNYKLIKMEWASAQSWGIGKAPPREEPQRFSQAAASCYCAEDWRGTFWTVLQQGFLLGMEEKGGIPSCKCSWGHQSSVLISDGWW